MGASVEEIEHAYRTGFRRFLRVAAGMLGSEERGFDAVQAAFVAALRHRNGFRGEGALDAWLWRMVVNSARKLQVERSEPAQRRIDAAAAPEPPHGIRSRIADLPERQRLVLFLRYYADLDYRTIADALGISEGTVGATLNAAHATLRRALEEVPR